MNTTRKKIIGALLLLWIGLAGTPVVTATTISIEPTPSTFSVGDTFSLNIVVTDVIDLYGFQFDIEFSPSILSATGITEGAFLLSGGSTLFIPGAIDNVLGTISFTGDTLLSAPPGVDGSGILASVTFQALVAGTSLVSPSNVVLLDTNLADIPFSTQNGTVDVPTPETLLLLLAGWVSLWFTQRVATRN
jgi:hypothetical protein